MHKKYNKARNLDKSTEDRTDAVNQGLAFSRMVSYIEEIRLDESIAPIFKLSELVPRYNAARRLHCQYILAYCFTQKLKNVSLWTSYLN